ncbi:MAG TPA: BON domain-containing protein [Rhodanobacteraceae bacterium]|nr:BON domain-containing protein [Rhodanobacteraceae bacterium]
MNRTFRLLSLSCLIAVLAALTACSTFTDRRGFNRVLNDRNVQITAQRTLDDDPALAGKVRIGTAVYDGVLLMIGEVPTEELKQRAEADVTGFEGVRRVDNEIDVMPIPPFSQRAADAALTARVKAALLDITSLPGFDPGRVNVSTAHGNVYLMGLVSHQEADAVTDVVRHVAGVQKVVRVFEYTD